MREIRLTWSSIFPLQATNDNRSGIQRTLGLEKSSWAYRLWFGSRYRCRPSDQANDDPPAYSQ